MARDSLADIDVAGIVNGMDHRRLGIYIVVTLFIAFFLAPLEAGILTAIKTDASIAQTVPFLPPGTDGATAENVGTAYGQLQSSIINSLVMAIPATLITIVLASMAAFGLTMVDWRGQVGILVLFLIGVFVPYQAVIIPVDKFWYQVFPLAQMLEPVARLKLVEPEHMLLVPLTITHIAYGIPIVTVLFRGYYQSMPQSFVEAAKIDGKSLTSIYTDIVLPLSKPMFGVVFIYQFTQIYNEFLFSLTIIKYADSTAATMTLVLSGIGASISGIDYGLRMAAAFLAALPTLLLYIAFSEQFAKGLQTGGA